MTEKENPNAVRKQSNDPLKLGSWLQANWGAALTIILVILAAYWIGWTMFKNPLILSDLRDQAYARGVITLLISIVTMVMAFLLVIQAFTTKGDDAEKRFTRAREVFTVLMGVLGTIVGFYFGSTEKAVATMEIADIRVADKQLLTHISGGTQPYRYSIVSSEKDFKSIKNRVSEDGWIIETLEQPLKPGSVMTIEVGDSKDRKASKEYKPDKTSPSSASAQTATGKPGNSLSGSTPQKMKKTGS